MEVAQFQRIRSLRVVDLGYVGLSVGCIVLLPLLQLFSMVIFFESRLAAVVPPLLWMAALPAIALTLLPFGAALKLYSDNTVNVLTLLNLCVYCYLSFRIMALWRI